MPEPDAARGGRLLPLRPRTGDGEIRLEPPRLEPLTAAEEAEAVDLLAGLLAAAARRSGRSASRLRRAA